MGVSISEFRGEYYFLSNFYSAPVTYNGMCFENNEAAFQAAKCPERMTEFCRLNPSEAKRLGRRVKLRGDWEAVKDTVMYEICKAKFSQNPDLADKLVATKDAELIEGNTWGDRIWGVCDGVGENRLGIYEPEANVVRLIYQMFYDDRTIPEICYILNQQGIPSPRGGQWTYSTVKIILTNEKYSGDVLMQKTVTVDIFSHRSIRNDGRANQFFIQGYHKAIIPRELWLEVQQILKGENVVPVPSVDEVADLSASDVPRILDGFFVIKPRKDGNNEYLRQL